MLDSNLKLQLQGYLERISQPVEIVASLDDSEKSREMLDLLNDIESVSNLVKLDAAVKFPPLWSRKATAPGPVEAYRDQPWRFPPVWGFKDYDWIEWTIDTNTVM